MKEAKRVALVYEEALKHYQRCIEDIISFGKASRLGQLIRKHSSKFPQ